MKKETAILMIQGLFGGLLQLVFLGAFLLIPAGLIPGGTWYWPRLLIFIGGYGIILEASIITLAIIAPENLKARLKSPVTKKQSVTDRILMSIFMSVFLAYLIFIPIDIFYLKLLSTPTFFVSILGASLILIGYLIIVFVIYQNSFASPVVEDQKERGQKVIDTGLYSIIRHPLYLGMLPFLVGIPLWLGTYTGAIAALITFSLITVRIFSEEKFLIENLSGYKEYMKKVKYRLIPYIW